MNKSESIIKLAAALAKAQAEMPVVKMNAQNPFLKNKYADLGAVIEASRPVLAKNGLAMIQSTIGDGVQIGVTTLLTHESGEWLEDTIYLTLGEEKGKSSAQVAGSIISYLRRYSWASFLGMYADEDTDGNHPKTSEPVRKQESKAPDHTKLVDRYNDRLVRAATLGIDVKAWELNDKMTDDEIIKLGTSLNAEIEKAGKKNG